jgi:rare lipoprotein A
MRLVAVAGLVSLLAACASAGGAASGGGSSRPFTPVADPAPIVSGTMRAYQVRGRWYRPEEQPHYDEVGLASWYGDQFNGRPTATGERFDMHALTAAHKTLPLPGLIEVTNLANGRVVVLRVNDRGPFIDDRILDLSRGAAEVGGRRRRGPKRRLRPRSVPSRRRPSGCRRPPMAIRPRRARPPRGPAEPPRSRPRPTSGRSGSCSAPGATPTPPKRRARG